MKNKELIEGIKNENSFIREWRDECRYRVDQISKGEDLLIAKTLLSVLMTVEEKSDMEIYRYLSDLFEFDKSPTGFKLVEGYWIILEQGIRCSVWDYHRLMKELLTPEVAGKYFDALKCCALAYDRCTTRSLLDQ